MAGSSHPEATLTLEQVEELTNDLRENILTTEQLVKKYSFKSRTSIIDFNNGKTYHRDIEYPISIRRIGKLTEAEVNAIIDLLRNTKQSYANIAKQFGVEYKAISRIDKGVLHNKKEIDYPIRKKVK